jgi:hypothetical protein
MRRLAGAAEGAALGLLLGLLLGLADGLLAPALAGERSGERLIGLLALDGALLMVLGGLLGTIRGRTWRRVTWAALAVVVLAAGFIGLRGGVTAGALRTEHHQAWRLSRPLPALGRTPDARPVLLISLDTVRADALAHMPLLSARAEGALRFTQVRSASSWTLPAMASLHTGLPFPEHGAAQMSDLGGAMVRTRLAPSVPTLAEQLQQDGYINAAVVTNPFNGIRYGFHRGFDRFTDLSRLALRRYALRRSSLLRLVSPSVTDVGAQVTDAGITLLSALVGGRYLLWLHYLDAHAPYAIDPASLDPLARCELPDCFNGWSEVRQGKLTLSEGEKSRIREMYEADLRYLDIQLDRLLSEAQRLGVLQDALVVITADHGEAFWERGEVEHGSSFHEAQVRIPLLIWQPGRAGQTVSHSVGLDDVAGAVLSWTGGGDLAALEPGSPDQQVPMGSLLFSADGVACADGRHKAVQTERLRVYDTVADPLEQTDISQSQPGIAQGFAACLRRRDAPQVSAPFDIAGLQALGYIDR